MRLIAVFALLMLLASCSSKNPIYEEKDLVDVPELIGKWEDREEPSAERKTAEQRGYWQVDSLVSVPGLDASPKTYYLTHVLQATGEVQYFLARFIKLKGKLFADIQMLKTIEGMPPEKIDIHCIGLVKQDRNRITFSMPDMKHIAEMVDDGKMTVKLEGSGEEAVLDEPTDKLKEFAIKYSNDTLVFRHFCVVEKMK